MTIVDALDPVLPVEANIEITADGRCAVRVDARISNVLSVLAITKRAVGDLIHPAINQPSCKPPIVLTHVLTIPKEVLPQILSLPPFSD